jgi:hypothetical protein
VLTIAPLTLTQKHRDRVSRSLFRGVAEGNSCATDSAFYSGSARNRRLNGESSRQNGRYSPREAGPTVHHICAANSPYDLRVSNSRNRLFEPLYDTGAVEIPRELQVRPVVRPDGSPPEIAVTPVRRAGVPLGSASCRSLFLEVLETAVHTPPAHRSPPVSKFERIRRIGCFLTNLSRCLGFGVPSRGTSVSLTAL